MAGLIVVVMRMRFVVLNRHNNDLTMTHAALGNHLIGERAYLLGFPFQQRHFKATAVVKMHMQAGERQVVMIMESTR